MVERLASSSLVVVVLVLLLSTWGVRAEEEAMSALDLTEDNFKDKVPVLYLGTGFTYLSGTVPYLYREGTRLLFWFLQNFTFF